MSMAPIALLVAVLALVGTLTSTFFQWQANQYVADQNFRAAQRQSDIKMVEIAVGILRAPVNDDVAQIRSWALDVIDTGANRKFTTEERAELLKKSLPAEVGAMRFEPIDPCSPLYLSLLKDKEWAKMLEGRCAAPSSLPKSPAPQTFPPAPAPMPLQ